MRVKVHVQSPRPAPAAGRLTLRQSLSPFLTVLTVSGLSCARLSAGGAAVSGGRAAYTALLLTASCLSIGTICWDTCQAGAAGVAAAGATAGVTRAVVMSAFFGLAPLLLTLPVTVALTVGCRRMTALLGRLQEVCAALEGVGDYQTLLRRVRRSSRLLAAAATVLSCFPLLGVLAAVIPGCATLDTMECLRQTWAIMLFAIPWMIFNIMSLKMVFFAMCFSACFDHVNGALRALTGHVETDFGDLRSILQYLCASHRKLSQAYEFVLLASKAELIPFMFFGVAGPVYFSMLGFILSSDALGSAQWSAAAFGLVTCLLGAIVFVIAIYLPCEASQQVINSVYRIQNTLWDIRMCNNEHLEQPVALYFDQLSHDKDSMGDLRLFRLHRATTTSCLTVTATYVIVLLQFLTGGSGPEQAPPTAVTSPLPSTAAGPS
ncbi:hypothetical protein FJT64_003452 [Amphibalanus amphitrite]|uniref:Gustatory receptor n=1 Tax=Amphibalanus amphitrite TaxID=1232801 RepID=A0A6A4WC13_AMPAM|nr:hypothetical protein FJT64_003452 [Amphibalanus amphitrite]